MDNTVGSYENKHWQKKWLPMKRSLVLTPDQKSVLVGSLLGDGTLRLGAGAINVNFKVEHGLRQKDYVFWKYKIFQPWVLTEPKISYRYREENRTRYEKSWWFRTVRHPLLTEFYHRFYPSGRKVVPERIRDDLTPLALAVWIMDDGCYSRSHIDISTYSFTLDEIILLQMLFKDNFLIESKYFRDRDKGYRMYFDLTNSKRVIEIILPYVIPSLSYKVGFCNPVTTESPQGGDKIVSKIVYYNTPRFRKTEYGIV